MFRWITEFYRRHPRMAQFFRFCVNGGVSAGIHYGVYVLMMQFIQIDIAYSIGYVVSFIYNFFLTCYWTFHASPTWTRLLGFSGSHVVNYLIHVVLFHLLTVWGVHRLIAPVLVLMVAVPTNFMILRFVYRNKSRDEKGDDSASCLQ